MYLRPWQVLQGNYLGYMGGTENGREVEYRGKQKSLSICFY
jgi:hypothetical protein